MVIITSAFPTELLDCVFSFLASDKSTIGSCRLVCRVFQDVVSPYLITRVVFANRLSAITRLLTIVNHPCFHRYISELVYDASEYDDRLISARRGAFGAYVRECMNAPRTFKDDDWLRRRMAGDTELTRIDQMILESQDQDAAFEDDGIVQIIEDEEFGREDYYDRPYELGCHKGFVEYRELSRSQMQIKRRNLARRVLTIAFSKLPALRSIVLTDWRGLVRSGESYDACARRLFGDTLAPELRFWDYEADATAFNDILSASAQVPNATFETFTVGPHPFEHPSMPREGGSHGIRDQRDSQHLSQSALREADRDELRVLFRKLRRLYLPLCIHHAVLDRTELEPLYPSGLFETFDA